MLQRVQNKCSQTGPKDNEKAHKWTHRQMAEAEGVRERERGEGRREVATLTVADNNVDNTSFYFRLHKLFNTKDK